MTEALPALGWALVGALVLATQRGRFGPREYGLVWLAFAIHVLASFAQVWITRGVYGSGDLTGYHDVGLVFADRIRRSPEWFFPEVVRLTLQMENSIYPGGLSSTTTMMGIAALTSVLCFDSIYGQCVLLGLIGFSGQLAIYLVFRETTSRAGVVSRNVAQVASTLIPSTVFWSAGLLKETVAIGGFGWMFFALHRWVERRELRAVVILAAGAFVVALTKAYILIAFSVAAMVYWYWGRAVRTGRSIAIRPVYIIVGAALAVVLVIAVGKLFPRYSVTEFGDEASNLQTIGARISGGSNYSLGATDRSLAGQLAFAPLALLTAMFRPFFFEISSATAAMNAVETTIITVLVIRSLVRHGIRPLGRLIMTEPVLAFSAAFVVIFGVGVGLASTNMGSLSRYRAPLVPFLALLVLTWNGIPKRQRTAERRRGPAVLPRSGEAGEP